MGEWGSPFPETLELQQAAEAVLLTLGAQGIAQALRNFKTELVHESR